MAKKPTQKDRILAHLLAGHSLSSLEAWAHFGCYRLGARIYELRRQGYTIATGREGSAQYARYRLLAMRGTLVGFPKVRG